MLKLKQILSISKQVPQDVINVPREVINELPVNFKISISKQLYKKKRIREIQNDINFVREMAINEKMCHPYLPKKEDFKTDCSSESIPLCEIRSYYEKNTYENQREFADNIINKIQDTNGKISQILALAPTQSGKTGTMIACVHKCVNEARIIPWNHIFVYTPHSSKDWISQTKLRFPSCLRNNIHHRNNTNILMKKIKKILDRKEKNILLIIDEAHIACKYNQSLFNMYKTLGLYDRNILYENNIKIIMFTATPEGLKSAIENEQLPWKQYTDILHMNVPEQYLSIDDFHKKGIIHSMKDLCGYDKKSGSFDTSVYFNIVDIMKHIDPKKPKYHIIRTLNGKNHLRTIKNFISLFFSDKEFDTKYTQYVSKIPIEMKNNVGLISEPLISSKFNFDINRVLSNIPKKHYFIFIKDKLRCAKTIDTTHVGVLYERKVKNPKFSTMIQGLAGRATGIQKSYPSAIYFTLIPEKSYPKNFLDFINDTK